MLWLEWNERQDTAHLAGQSSATRQDHGANTPRCRFSCC